MNATIPLSCRPSLAKFLMLSGLGLLLFREILKKKIPHECVLIRYKKTDIRCNKAGIFFPPNVPYCGKWAVSEAKVTATSQSCQDY